MISGADKEITIFSKEGKLFQIGKYYFNYKNTHLTQLKILDSHLLELEEKTVLL